MSRRHQHPIGENEKVGILPFLEAAPNMTPAYDTEVEIPDSAQIEPRPSAWQIGLYFLLLLLVCNVGSPGGLSAIPVSFLLKDKLHLGAEQVAVYGFLAGIPWYLGVGLGLMRDRWQPLGGQDRGYLLILPPIIAVILLWLAHQPLTYGRILAAMLCGGMFGVLLSTAIQALMAEVAQRHALAGRLSAAYGAAFGLPLVFSAYAGGWLTAHVAPETVLKISAAIVLLVMGFTFWRPRAVYGASIPTEPSPGLAGLRQAVSRLIRHRPMYLPAAILFLWNFAPGWNTPLFFYLTNQVKLSSETYGSVMSILNLFSLLFVLLYGLLCRRWNLRTLLWIGTILGIAGGPLFWFIHTPFQAVAVAAFAGASCGIANGAYIDLLMRSCPKGSEGTVMALSCGATAIAWNTADILGSWLYARGGFGLDMIATVFIGLLILVPILTIPGQLVATRDGEALTSTVTA